MSRARKMHLWKVTRKTKVIGEEMEEETFDVVTNNEWGVRAIDMVSKIDEETYVRDMRRKGFGMKELRIPEMLCFTAPTYVGEVWVEVEEEP